MRRLMVCVGALVLSWGWMGYAQATGEGGTGAEIEKPTTLVFNNKRKFNQEQILLNDVVWRCARYRDDGSCVSVERVPDGEVTLFDDLLETVNKSGKWAKKGNYKIEKADDTPCACVFNNKRMWNPEKILWNDQYWRCAHYREDGSCSKVELIPDSEQANVEQKHALSDEQGAPVPEVFNNKRIWNPEKVLWNDQYWRCGHYREDGSCSRVEPIPDSELSDVAEKPTTSNGNGSPEPEKLEPKPDLLEFGGVQFMGLDRLYSCEAFGEHQLRNKLTLAEFNRFLALAEERKMWNEVDIQGIQSGKPMVGMSACGLVSLMGYANNGGGSEEPDGHIRGWAEYSFEGDMVMVDFVDHIAVSIDRL